MHFFKQRALTKNTLFSHRPLAPSAHCIKSFRNYPKNLELFQFGDPIFFSLGMVLSGYVGWCILYKAETEQHSTARHADQQQVRKI